MGVTRCVVGTYEGAEKHLAALTNRCRETFRQGAASPRIFSIPEKIRDFWLAELGLVI